MWERREVEEKGECERKRWERKEHGEKACLIALPPGLLPTTSTLFVMLSFFSSSWSKRERERNGSRKRRKGND